MNKKKLLGLRLRELRKRKNINQEKLAELIGVEPATISNIENGKNYPSLANLENIINVLKVSFIDVFDFEHKKINVDLLGEIVAALRNNPDKTELVYKIVQAIIK